MLEIRNVEYGNLSDFVRVCTPTVKDKAFSRGIKERIAWCKDLLDRFGYVGKIAYVDGKAVAQLQYYPDEADPLGSGRQDIMVLHCVYNPNPQYQRKGIARKLVESLIEELKRKPLFRYIVSYAFETGEYFSQREFLLRMGFKPLNGESVYYSLSGEELKGYVPFSLWRGSREKYVPISEDVGRALIFYSPACQFGYVFALRTAEELRKLASEIPVVLVNYWKKPEELKRRGKHWMIVNAVPIYSNPLLSPRKFREEVNKALSKH